MGHAWGGALVCLGPGCCRTQGLESLGFGEGVFGELSHMGLGNLCERWLVGLAGYAHTEDNSTDPDVGIYSG